MHIVMYAFLAIFLVVFVVPAVLLCLFLFWDSLKHRKIREQSALSENRASAPRGSKAIHVE